MFSLIKNENLLKTHHSLSKNGDGGYKERLAVATTSDIPYYFGQGYLISSRKSQTILKSMHK